MVNVTVLRPLNEVMVECLPAALPSSIQVDLSQLNEVGAVIRVQNLVVGPGVIIPDRPQRDGGGPATAGPLGVGPEAVEHQHCPRCPEG